MIYILFVLFFILIRNTVALSVGLAHTDAVYNYNQKLIREDFSNYYSNRLYYGNGFNDHLKYMVNIHKWTFKQFYPNGVK